MAKKLSVVMLWLAFLYLYLENILSYVNVVFLVLSPMWGAIFLYALNNIAEKILRRRHGEEKEIRLDDLVSSFPSDNILAQIYMFSREFWAFARLWTIIGCGVMLVIIYLGGHA